MVYIIEKMMMIKMYIKVLLYSQGKRYYKRYNKTTINNNQMFKTMILQKNNLKYKQ